MHQTSAGNIDAKHSLFTDDLRHSGDLRLRIRRSGTHSIATVHFVVYEAIRVANTVVTSGHGGGERRAAGTIEVCEITGLYITYKPHEETARYQHTVNNKPFSIYYVGRCARNPHTKVPNKHTLFTCTATGHLRG